MLSEQRPQQQLPANDHKITAHQALLEILNLEQQAMVMGANDYEPHAFASIKKSLQMGNTTPEDALHTAQSILNSKQDYH
jgi:hydroxymethylpyrimidine pyrophosphatase-like HAD family hydrolase